MFIFKHYLWKIDNEYYFELFVGLILKYVVAEAIQNSSPFVSILFVDLFIPYQLIIIIHDDNFVQVEMRTILYK